MSGPTSGNGLAPEGICPSKITFYRTMRTSDAIFFAPPPIGVYFYIPTADIKVHTSLNLNWILKLTTLDVEKFCWCRKQSQSSN